MKHALCIGINQYGGGSNLEGCVNDAHDWGELLADLGFDVQLLLDRDATAACIGEAFRATLARAQAGDLVAITYSGHGSQVPDLEADEPDRLDECWCAADILRTPAGYITDDTIARWLSGRPAGVNVVVISDSCHSGTVARGFCAPRVRTLPPAAFLPSDRAARVGVSTRAPRGETRYPAILLAGCQDEEYSYDAAFLGRPNGAFTRAAIDSWSEGLTYAEWMTAIRKVLPNARYPQRPQLDCSPEMAQWRALV
jgi:hypothetical protein